MFWVNQATPGWRAAAASGIRDTPVNCLKIWDAVVVSQVLAGILRLLTWSSSWIASLFYRPCVACYLPIHLEGGRRWEGSPGTVAVIGRLVLAHCFEGIYGCGTWAVLVCEPKEQCPCLWLQQGWGSGMM